MIHLIGTFITTATIAGLGVIVESTIATYNWTKARLHTLLLSPKVREEEGVDPATDEEE